MLCDVPALPHGLERLLTQAINTEIVPDLPDIDENFVSREVFNCRIHLTGEEVMLDKSKSLRSHVRKLDNIFEVFLTPLKIFPEVYRLGAQEVFLNGKGLLVLRLLPSKNDDNDGVSIPV